MTKTVGIFLFDNVEVLDFAGPFEVFTTAARMHARRDAHAAPVFRVCTISATGQSVCARAGLVLQAECAIGRHPKLDLLIVPGGVVDDVVRDVAVVDWIARQARQVELLASVCTGAFLLAEAGLLDGKVVTTHWEDMSDLETKYPSLRLRRGVRWVDEGNVVTSAGISAGIDMTLHLVERCHGRELAERTARQMEFDWTENVLDRAQ